MGDLFPEPFANAGGDEVTTAPVKGDRSLLAAERGTQKTSRLETDSSGNLYVNVAEGSIDVTVGEVEIKNDVGNPVPVSDGGGSLTVDGTVAVSNLPAVQPVSDNGGSLTVDGTIAVSNFPASVEVSNDSGNPLPVNGTVTVNAGTGPFPVSDNGGSLTVDGTFFQATQPVSAASLPLPSGAATSALQTQPGVDIGDVTVNNTSGAAAVNIQDGGNSITVDGTLAVTFPASSSATESNVSASVSNVTLLVSNASRKTAMVYNDSTSDLYVKFGATASTSSFTVKLVANAYYELPLPVYTGIIDGIWTVAVGNARITEY